MRPLASALGLSLAILAVPASPRPPAFLDLEHCPGVVDVTTAGPADTPCIIHILDWHYIDRERFEADAAVAEGRALTRVEADTAFSRFLDDVAELQAEQGTILAWILSRTNVDTVGVEGLVPSDVELFGYLARLAWKRDTLPAMRLNAGAAGRALADGRIRVVLPIEEGAKHAAADPFDDDTEFRDVADDALHERDEAIVRALLAGDRPVTVVVLGGAHDLETEILRQSDGRRRYVRVAARKFRSLACAVSGTRGTPAAAAPGSR